MTKTQRTFLSCVVWIIICLILSGLAGWVTGLNIESWYNALNKPSFNPPAWVFGPVWTALYIMIGISGGLIWVQRNAIKPAFAFYILQLLANFIWSFIFFGLHQMGWAFVDVIVLDILILLTIIFAYNKNKPAAYLLMPYFIWVIFASILNYNLWQLN